MDDEQTRHLQERRNILQHRLRLLEVRRDRQGSETPPDILMEIEGTQRDLRLIEAQLRLPPISPEIAEAVGPAGQFLALDYAIKGLRQRMDDAIAQLGEQIGEVREESREWRANERSERHAGQTLNRVVFLVFGIVLLIELVVLALLVGARWLA